MGTINGDYIGTTIGIHSDPFPAKNQTVVRAQPSSLKPNSNPADWFRIFASDFGFREFSVRVSESSRESLG